jgi:catalase
MILNKPVKNIVVDLGNADEDIQLLLVCNFYRADEEYGPKIGKCIRFGYFTIC